LKRQESFRQCRIIERVEKIMSRRTRAFLRALSEHFEEALQKEVARVDLSASLRRSGVLVTRALVGPALIAFCKAVRHAWRAEEDLSPIAVTKEARCASHESRAAAQLTDPSSARMHDRTKALVE
jgi:hypothetical protein